MPKFQNFKCDILSIFQTMCNLEQLLVKMMRFGTDLGTFSEQDGNDLQELESSVTTMDMCFGYRLGARCKLDTMRVATKGETLFPLPHCQMQINVVGELIFANAMAKQDVRQLETSKCVCGNTLLISASRSLKICATRVNTMFRNPIIC